VKNDLLTFSFSFVSVHERALQAESVVFEMPLVVLLSPTWRNVRFLHQNNHHTLNRMKVTETQCTQNSRQKIFNRGALRLCRGLDTLKFDKNS